MEKSIIVVFSVTLCLCGEKVLDPRKTVAKRI
jgi:hypothetical protein